MISDQIVVPISDLIPDLISDLISYLISYLISDLTLDLISMLLLDLLSAERGSDQILAQVSDSDLRSDI